MRAGAHPTATRRSASRCRPSVELKIVRSDPGVKGDTATGATKPATLETGLVVNVPLFINEGDTIKVSTSTGGYIERAATA